MMRGVTCACVLACTLLGACDGDDDDAPGLDAGMLHGDAAATDAAIDAAISADAGTGW